jgi:hypothetical protein
LLLVKKRIDLKKKTIFHTRTRARTHHCLFFVIIIPIVRKSITRVIA